MSNFQQNPDSPDRLAAKITEVIGRVDEAIRAEHTGKPAAEVAEYAAAAFSEAGINFRGLMQEYGQAVENDKPFQWKVSGRRDDLL